MLLVDGGDESRRQELGPGGQGAGLGAIEDALVHRLDLFVAVADVVPDAGLVRHDIGRLAALQDDVVHAVGRIEVFAQEICGHVRDLDRIQRASPGPGGGPMSRLAGKREDHRKHGVAAAAIARPEAAAAVVVDDRVHVPEKAGPDHVRPAGDDLLGGGAEDLDRPRELELVHGLLDGDGGRGGRGAHRVVAAAVAGRAVHQGILGRHPPFLRQHGQGIKFAEQADHGLPGAVAGDEAGRHAGQAPLDGEAGLFQGIGQELRGTEFLQAQFGIGPDGIRDLPEAGQHVGTGQPVQDEPLFLGRRRRGCGCRRRGRGEDQDRG